MQDNIKPIEQLIKSLSKETILLVTPLALTASDRKYFRVILNNNQNYIAVYNDNLKENKAFISFSKSLDLAKVKVPKVHAISEDGFWYLQDDLGHTTLFDFLNQKRKKNDFDLKCNHVYKSIIKDLIHIQTEGYKTVDFSLGFPRAAFDRQSIQWDLNYFKYYFLKLSGLNFDEQLLELDFEKLTQMLLATPSNFFMFRDFQSRNIMLKGNSIYYIDFQGGRKGPLQYDLASLLFDAKAELSQDFRLKMLDYYFENLPEKLKKEQTQFKEEFWNFALIRILQAMGAYGYRGLYEKKQHFINSIPFALNNLKLILKQLSFQNQIPYLFSLLEQMGAASELQKYLPNKVTNSLVVQINSFSYKQGIPQDKSDNGGGFVFDCRSIHNPGRYEEFKALNGKDKPVIDFFKTVPEMDSFLSHVYDLVDYSVQKYIDRGFTSLMVNFGCTGGQHRSVYSAEKLAEYLTQKFNLRIELHHIEQEKKRL